MEIKKNQKSNGKLVYDVSLDSGRNFRGYCTPEKNNSVAVHTNSSYFCTLQLDGFDDIMGVANIIETHGGDPLGYLISLAPRRGERSLKSDDGKYFFGFTIHKNGVYELYVKNVFLDKQHALYPKGLVKSDDEAMDIIEREVDRYNNTGRFQTIRKQKFNKGQLPFDEEDVSFLNSKPQDIVFSDKEQELQELLTQKEDELHLWRVENAELKKEIHELNTTNKELELILDNYRNEYKWKEVVSCPDCGKERYRMYSTEKGKFFLGCSSGEHHRTRSYDKLAHLCYEEGFIRDIWVENEEGFMYPDIGDDVNDRI